MLFSSAIFLWLFLPLVFWANYFIQPKYSNILLLISSLIFYAWGEPYFVYLMILSIFVNWMVARGIYRFQMYKRMILFLGILYNLAVLLHFKYAGFGVQILNRFLSGGGGRKRYCQSRRLRCRQGYHFLPFRLFRILLMCIVEKRSRRKNGSMWLCTYLFFRS